MSRPGGRGAGRTFARKLSAGEDISGGRRSYGAPAVITASRNIVCASLARPSVRVRVRALFTLSCVRRPPQRARTSPTDLRRLVWPGRQHHHAHQRHSLACLATRLMETCARRPGRSACMYLSVSVSVSLSVRVCGWVADVWLIYGARDISDRTPARSGLAATTLRDRLSLIHI